MGEQVVCGEQVFKVPGIIPAAAVSRGGSATFFIDFHDEALADAVLEHGRFKAGANTYEVREAFKDPAHPTVLLMMGFKMHSDRTPADTPDEAA